MNLLATTVADSLRTFEQCLSERGPVRRVGDLESYWAGLASLKDQAPGLIVIDISLCGRQIKDLVQKTKQQLPGARILVVAPSVPAADELVLLRAGVVGCCERSLPLESVARIVAMVEDGGVWISHGVLPLVLKQLQIRTVANEQHHIAPHKPIADIRNYDSLTPRERQIAELVGSGVSNKLIARELNITDRTVKAHLSAIFQKLGMQDRLRLALYIKDREYKKSEPNLTFS